MSEYVDFHYMPLEGRITGNQVLKQTEDAINDLGNKVYNIEIDEEEIQQAIEDSQHAVDVADEALATVTTNRAVWFNSVAEMKEASIETGITAATRGFAFSGDGGHAIYEIRQPKSGDVDNGETLIILDNGSVAECIDVNVPRSVDSIAELKAQNLLKGYEVSTKGYYEANDGGNSVYNIRNRIPYEEVENNSVALSKSVPASMEKAIINQLGGKTYAFNQIVKEITSTYWANWTPDAVSVSYNDGVAEVTITDATKQAYQYQHLLKDAYKYNIRKGHVYYYTVDIKSNIAGTAFYNNNINTAINLGAVASANVWETKNGIITATADRTSRFGTYPNNNFTGQIFSLRNAMIIDLTIMFGAGNEPSTVQAFKQIFRGNYYAYDNGSLLTAGVTSVASRDTSYVLIDNHIVSSAIRGISGYGWSAGNAYNYVDYENKKFVKHVDRINLGDLTWYRNETEPGSGEYRFSANITTYNPKVSIGVYDVVYNMLSCRYVASTADNTMLPSQYDKIMAMQQVVGETSISLVIVDNSYNDAATFKTSLDGVYLLVEIATPVESDISGYVMYGNVLNVVPGGQLVFYNTIDPSGVDYRIPVPSDELFYTGDIEDGGSIIFLDNGNVAELITDGIVDVKQWGAKGDGVTDDGAIINTCIASPKVKTIFFNGIFATSIPIINNNSVNFIMQPFSEITALNAMQYVHAINTIAKPGGYDKMTKIRYQNVRIRCNGFANTIGVAVNGSLNSDYDIQVYECAYIGIYVRYLNVNPCGGNKWKIKVYNENDYGTDTIGVIGGQDEIFEDIVTCNTYIGVKAIAGGNVYGIVHQWLSKASLYVGSQAFVVAENATNLHINTLICDTTQIAITLAKNYNYVVVDDLMVENNTNVVNAAMLADHPIYHVGLYQDYPATYLTIKHIDRPQTGAKSDNEPDTFLPRFICLDGTYTREHVMKLILGTFVHPVISNGDADELLFAGDFVMASNSSNIPTEDNYVINVQVTTEAVIQTAVKLTDVTERYGRIIDANTVGAWASL